MLQGVTSKEILGIWDKIAPMLQKAIDKTQHDFDIEDILKFLLSSDMQLWIWVENAQIIACCVSQIINYPRRKVCQLPYIAGSGLKRFIESENIIMQWARKQGCSQLEGFDRGGWVRVLKVKDWFRVWTTIRKDI